MADTFANITKTGNCDSCGQEKVLHPVPHHQVNNPKLWWYCDVCKFAHDTEKGVQKIIRAASLQNPGSEDDSQVLADAHEKVATELLLEKAKNEALVPNEKLVTEGDSDVQEGEIVEEPAPQTEPTAETVPSEETSEAPQE